MLTDSPQLIPFDIVFLLRLRYISKTLSLTHAIRKQHGLGEDVPVQYIEAILTGKTNHRVLLMLDGYDEYTPGTNQDIDTVIESGIGNCFLILTSRPGEYLSQSLRNRMDGEIMIEGFSKKKIAECSTIYLRSAEMSAEMLRQAKHTGIYELLHVPIILVMTVVVFIEEKALPKSKTGIYKTIFRLVTNRTTLKNFGLKSEDIPQMEHLLHTLGEFAWKALQNDVQQLLLKKVDYIFTARIRRMGEGNIFTLCVSSHFDGEEGWYPHPRSAQVQDGGYFHLRSRMAVPPLRIGGTPSQFRTRGMPHQDWMGYPPLGLNEGTPHQEWMDIPSPHWDWMEYTHQDRMSVPPLGLDGVPLCCQEIGRQSSFAVGGMSLAFIQEDYGR